MLTKAVSIVKIIKMIAILTKINYRYSTFNILESHFEIDTLPSAVFEKMTRTSFFWKVKQEMTWLSFGQVLIFFSFT